ncbi:hypothetical protein XaCFBP7622_16230 [Xanthomonas arboricola]|nr:hypothetical protein XaCFBP7622_16230 [Xanthomonas arboricola]
MIDPRGRHQDGKQAQNQGVVRARSHARRWPDHRLASVAWNPARPRLGGPAGVAGASDRGSAAVAAAHRGCRPVGAWVCLAAARVGQRTWASSRPRYAGPGAASCPTRTRQRVMGEGLSCGDDTST